ncbi:MAG: glycosyltransferase [Candidatus Thorarchaeota archaeon]
MNFVIVGKSCYSFTTNGAKVVNTLAGHTQAFTKQLIPYLLHNGHRVALLCPLKSGINDSIIWNPKNIVPNNLYINCFSSYNIPKIPNGTLYFDFITAFSEINTKFNGIDWVFSVYAFPYICLINSLKPFYNFYTAVFLRGGDGYKFLDIDYLKNTLGLHKYTETHIDTYRTFLNKSDLIFTVSNWLKNKVMQYGIPVNDIIPAPALTLFSINNNNSPIQNQKEFFIEKIDNKTIKNKINLKKKWLITVSRFHKDKHLDLIIDSFIKWDSNNWQLILAGDGPLKNEIISQVSNHKDIIVIQLPLELTQLLFQSCDAYIHAAIPSSSFIDSRPNSITTSAYYGKPVILPKSEIGGAKESISDINYQELGFTLSKLKENMIIDIIEKFNKLDNQSLINVISLSNYEYAKFFNPENIFNKIEKALDVFENAKIKQNNCKWR